MASSVQQGLKNRLRRTAMWAAMALIVLLFFFSVYGAFIGPERAKAFFNTAPLGIYWVVFALLLAVGIVLFRRLLRVPALLLVHAGCILILAGAIWGSDAGRNIQKRLFGTDIVPTGQMQIYEGYSDNRVVLEDNEIRELPFYIRLKDFRLEYYEPGHIYIQIRQGDAAWEFPVQIGARFQLGLQFGTVEIVKVFENFKIAIEGDSRAAGDEPGTGTNAALEVRIEPPNGPASTRYVFERSRGHIYPDDQLYMSYERVIRDYVSELQVIRDGQVVARKDIEVNHPLHFGGYHFYQHSYDAQAGEYTVLMVSPDSGLASVYGGFLALCIGAFWHFWLRKLPKPVQTDREQQDQKASKWKSNTQSRAY
ncbi:MAG: cytochrome c biogenesis protein ResB [Sedimentisphaerales bacterium]|nr:cytochrome c biogenesis protein ResB [Sedimentisphaerales bacterium]